MSSMIFNATWIFVFLSLCGMVVSNPDRAVDCRKFVFAPLCRGVAAKRNPSIHGHSEPAINNAESVTQLLESLSAALTSFKVEVEEDNNSGKLPNLQNKIENVARMHQKDRINRLLSLLFKRQQTNSERNSLTVQESENL